MPFLGTQPSRGLVGTAGIDADAITSAKIADDQIDSEHYAAGSIDTAHIAANQIDGTLTKDALIADYSDVTITAADLIMYGDATDSNNTKRDTVQGILDLAGGGKILQVVNSDIDGSVSTTNTSYTATSVFQAITPTASSSKIWAIATCGTGGDGPSGSYEERLVKWHVDIAGGGYSAIGQDFGTQWNDASTQTIVQTYQVLYSVSSTNAHTFKLYIKTDGGASTYLGYAAVAGVGSTITCFEIGA